MFQAFKNHLENTFPKITDSRVIVAVSGGVDSMVLCHLLYRLKIDMVVAHCNFCLRGEESDKDAKFVKKWAEKHSVSFEIKTFDTQKYTLEKHLNTQLSARELRYNWFESLTEKYKASYIATAHHLDDNLETFLINLSRGTGIKGLTGIPEQNKNIIRPLLPFSKQQIYAFAQKENIFYRQDSSNTSDDYLRNRIRHHIVGELKKLHPTFLDNFKQTQTYLQQTDSFSKNQLQKIKNKLFKKIEQGYSIDLNYLQKQENISYLLYELFSPYGFSNISDLLQMLQSPSGKELQSKNYRLIKNREEWLLVEKTSFELEEFTIEEGASYIETPIEVKIEKVEKMEDFDTHHIYVDKDTLKFPLIFRHWQKGDYFYPISMKGKKKLSKFFKDEKFSSLDKENQWLLCSDNSIVWVVGKRADNRFRVTKKTNTILKITLVKT